MAKKRGKCAAFDFDVCLEIESPACLFVFSVRVGAAGAGGQKDERPVTLEPTRRNLLWISSVHEVLKLARCETYFSVNF